VTETVVTVLKFEHRKRAEVLVQTALFFNLSIPFLNNFVSIVSVTTGIKNAVVNGNILAFFGVQIKDRVQHLVSIVVLIGLP
jgi:hypothetical protein